MSIQMFNGVPVNRHQLHAKLSEDSDVEVFQKASRWDAAALGASLLKQGYKSVVPYSWVRGENPGEAGTFGYDPKTWADIQKNLQGKEANAARLTVQQSAHLEEAGRLMEVYAKQGKKAGLSEDQMFEMLDSAIRAFYGLGIKPADVRDVMHAIANPRPAEVPAETTAQ